MSNIYKYYARIYMTGYCSKYLWFQVQNYLPDFFFNILSVFVLIDEVYWILGLVFISWMHEYLVSILSIYSKIDLSTRFNVPSTLCSILLKLLTCYILIIFMIFKNQKFIKDDKN